MTKPSPAILAHEEAKKAKAEEVKKAKSAFNEPTLPPAKSNDPPAKVTANDAVKSPVPPVKAVGPRGGSGLSKARKRTSKRTSKAKAFPTLKAPKVAKTGGIHAYGTCVPLGECVCQS